MIPERYVGLVGFLALSAIFTCLAVWWKKWRLRTASQWPIAQGHVELIEESRDDHGFLKITLAYTYKIDGERYVGRDSFTFIRDDEAASFESGCRGKDVLVHYKPEKPQTWRLAREQMG